MDREDKEGFFRGHELSRFLILATITVVGWAGFYLYATRNPPEPKPGVVVTGKPVPLVVDRSPAFETVTDKTVVGFRDMAAYVLLLDRTRGMARSDLTDQARRDVFYAHLWDFPKDYRGVLVHVSGTALQALYYPSKNSRTGWIYEVWIVDPDLTKNPFVCVSEEVPQGFPIGKNLSEQVSFDGFFLKLMRYEAGDVPRAAPMLVGRIVWKPRPGGAVSSSNQTTYWMIGGLCLMFLFSMTRLGLALRRSFLPKRPSPSIHRPNDEIAPEELAAFLGDQAEGSYRSVDSS